MAGESPSRLQSWLWSPSMERVTSGVLAVGTGSVLGIARSLHPSPLGHGTHTQLGLGQCTFLALTDIPCPMCGMTTTFSLLAHMQPLEALSTQPFGLVLFALTVLVFAVSAAEVVQPRLRWRRLLSRLAPYEVVLATMFLIGMGLGWAYKIGTMGTV